MQEWQLQAMTPDWTELLELQAFQDCCTSWSDMSNAVDSGGMKERYLGLR